MAEITLFASRFAGLPRVGARLVLALLAVISIYGAVLGTRSVPPTPVAVSPIQRDADLYRAVSARVARGESYYTAAATEQRARGFPLKPFVTVRPPLLAEITALAGGPAAMGWALRALVLIAVIALALRLRSVVTHLTERLTAIGIAALSLLTIAQPDLAVWHEAWAATLIALSLALHRPGHWGLSLVVALVAALIRELALPFLGVMAVVALSERRWREAAAWAIGIVVVLGALALHASNVAAVVTAADPQSQGWSGAGGWPFVLLMLTKTSILLLCPGWIAALLIPLALIGWLGWRHPLANRAIFWLAGMITAFMLLGRPDNFYWGMLLAPLLPVGLAFAPRALADLAKAAR